MNDTLRFTRLDASSLRSYAKTLLVLVVVVAAVILVGRNSSVVLVASMTISLFAPSYPFSLDERAHLDTLYGVLPLRRDAVVWGRYLNMVLFLALATACGLTLTLLAAAITGESLAPGQLGAVVLLMSGLILVVYSIQLPVFFAVGFTKARPLTYITFFVLFCAGFMIGGAFGADVAPLLAALTAPTGQAVVLLVGVAALVCSAALSLRLYRRRDL